MSNNPGYKDGVADARNRHVPQETRIQAKERRVAVANGELTPSNNDRQVWDNQTKTWRRTDA